jgi:uncharacterized delta-60 repeat protein
VRLAAAANALALLAAAPGAAASRTAFVSTPLWGFGTATAVAVRPDGLLVAGRGNGQVLLVRYDAAGRVDKAFGTGGRVLTRGVPGTWDEATAAAVLVRGDDRIVVAGAAAGRDRDAVVLLRYLPDGTLDTSFAGGRVLSRPARRIAVADAALDLLDRVVVVGTATERRSSWLVQRYLPDGAPDPTFGTGGTLLVAAAEAGYDAGAAAVDVLPDGRIVVVGNDSGAPTVLRLLPNGLPDATWGVAGRAAFASALGRSVHDAVVGPDGSVVAAAMAGYHPPGGGTSSRVELVRWNAAGLPDPAFGENGAAVVPAPPRSAQPSLAVDAAGRYVVGATRHRYPDPDDAWVARLLPGGAADPAFATLRVAVEEYSEVLAVAATPDGVVAAGGTGESYYARRPLVTGLR